MKYGKPLREIFDADDGILTVDEVLRRLQELYPKGTWNRQTLGKRLFKYSVNHPYLKSLRNMESRSFLFSLGDDQFRRWNPTRDGTWNVWNGEMRRDMGEAEEEEEEAAGQDNELSALGTALRLENDLEDYLVSRLQMLEQGLQLHKSGRQYDTGAVGRIDLLATDRQGNFVVIELKAGEAGDRVCGQLLRYMSWVRMNLANGKQVRGIVVANEFAEGIRYAIQAAPGAELRKYTVQFNFSDVPHAGTQ